MVLPIANSTLLGGKRPLGTLSYVSHVFGEDVSSVTGPASIQAGDLLIGLQIGNSTTTAYGTGFTGLATATGSQTSGKTTYYSRAIVSYKIADGSEASASLGGWKAGTTNVMVAVYRATGTITECVVGSLINWGTNIGTKTTYAATNIGANESSVVISLHAMVSANGLNYSYSPTAVDAQGNDGSGTYRGTLLCGPVRTDTTITETDSDPATIAYFGYLTVR